MSHVLLVLSEILPHTHTHTHTKHKMIFPAQTSQTKVIQTYGRRDPSVEEPPSYQWTTLSGYYYILIKIQSNNNVLFSPCVSDRNSPEIQQPTLPLKTIDAGRKIKLNTSSQTL